MKYHLNINLSQIGFVFFVLLLVNGMDVFAQKDLYSTSTGQLILKAHLSDEVVDISSRDLLIKLDYETGNIEMKQEVASLIANNDSLQLEFENSKNKQIRFVGKLGLDYINTKGHPPLDFIVEGTIYPTNKQIIGRGHLVHIIQGTSYACRLSLSFTLQVRDFFPNYKSGDTDEELHIQIIQSLLARENE